ASSEWREQLSIRYSPFRYSPLSHHPHRLAVEEAADVFGDTGEIVLVVLLGDIAEMWRDDGIVHLAQWMIDRQWLDVEHIEAGAGDFLVAQGCKKRCFVDD